MVSKERFKEIQDYVMKLNLTEGFEDPVDCSVPAVYKRLVVGYLIVKTSDGRVISRPVYCGNDYGYGLFKPLTILNDDEELLGIVPATKMTFAVYGSIPDNNVSFENYKAGECGYIPDKFLGFEYEGMDHPDWIRALKQRIIYKLVWSEEGLERDSRMKKD